MFECHGEQHVKDVDYFSTTYNEVNKNDRYKRKLAQQYGFKYVTIECSSKNKNIVRQNCLNMLLNLGVIENE